MLFPGSTLGLLAARPAVSRCPINGMTAELMFIQRSLILLEDVPRFEGMEMKKILIVGMAMQLAGCTPATMEGFSKIAAQNGAERIDISAVPAWMNGSFRVGNSKGYVRRIASSDAIGWGPDGIGSDFDLVRDGYAARFGRMAFEISRSDLGGLAEARCNYSREEQRILIDRVTLATPLEPLRVMCRYRINGREAGMLSMVADPDTRARDADGRKGEITIFDTGLALQTRHGLAETDVNISDPSGYVMIDSNGKTVGALELTGGGSRRAIVPVNAAQRKAAVLAAITLALFWDPGDVG